MKKLLLSLLLLPGLLWAQDSRVNQRADFAIQYDLDSANATYCVVTGEGGSAWGRPIAGNGLIKTSGSSTTVTENTASQGPFAPVAVGDILFIYYQASGGNPSPYVRVVTAKASSASITVNTAITLTNGATFQYKHTTCGTAVTNGWIGVSQFEYLTMPVQYNAGDLTGGLDVVWECKSNSPGAAPIQVYPTTGEVHNIPTAGAAIGDALLSANPWDACRVGIKAGTSDSDGTVESITISLIGR